MTSPPPPPSSIAAGSANSPDDDDRWPIRFSPLAVEQLGSLPLGVAEAALALIRGPLARNPYRVSGPLTGELADLRSARVGPDHRILLYLNEQDIELVVLDIDRRSRIYRTRSPVGWWRPALRRRRRGDRRP